MKNKSRASWLTVVDVDIDESLKLMILMVIFMLMLMMMFMMMLMMQLLMLMLMLMMMIRGMRVRCCLKLGAIPSRNPPGRHSFLGRLKIIRVMMKKL